MTGDLEFLPPHRFSPLEGVEMLTGGDGQVFTQGSGQPYDLIDDLPTEGSGSRVTTRARGGAVHFDNPPQTSTGSRSYPQLDRAFFFTVDDTQVITQAFWGTPENAPPYYFQTLVKDDEVSIWAYADTGQKNFKVIANDNKASIEAWDDASPKKWIIINTEDFPSGTDPDELLVKLREIDTCEKDSNGNPLKMLVLCSQTYTT